MFLAPPLFVLSPPPSFLTVAPQLLAFRLPELSPSNSNNTTVYSKRSRHLNSENGGKRAFCHDLLFYRGRTEYWGSCNLIRCGSWRFISRSISDHDHRILNVQIILQWFCFIFKWKKRNLIDSIKLEIIYFRKSLFCFIFVVQTMQFWQT